ncbi:MULTISPECIES: lipopolysaccharide 3-alpha-galactosyltransferase [Providencia]|uniref:lipopolysaccharide 3-alpha-galactosyltransferase n=1 Tax=Providencia TaxID=586 RepID=UPI000E3D5D01|nr:MULTISPECIES: lipopolysaccharide 3-alpha-galactosyltransferase [Providencia]ELR5117647.1 lipopolysaccharide 3-alpha-galactosyltransferase [Providencia rettgeri]MBI6204030.1 lipopolysaccharide 3-alpha-galactosyltransferase [Providencia rettgeri]MCG5291951.1 lipopolysaccharide 3-alpha-galactosyltransferase [Providencia rettgeri]MCK9999624.1 lipopolysaccharide 3-alpha-galactosyltransferase [Providencia rettgeri]MCL0017881.1 lipopolysaccharide 3-alpha-galactosyltransferase [Providencia rettgeri
MFFNKENAVTQQIDLSSPDAIVNNDSLHISYGIDRNFLYGCGISIASLLKTNPDISFSFHVFTDYFDDEQSKLFKQLAEQYKTSIKVYLVDCEQLKLLPSTKNWSYATYFRFIIADYFSNQLDRMIYMDADIMCQGTLQPLLNIPFKDDEIAAVVPERDSIWWQKRADALGIPSIASGYFNAGFLVLNLVNWSKFDISTKAMDLLSQDVVKAKLSYLDQDILNMLLTGKVIYLDGKYNTQYSINYELQKGKKENPITSETVLIHYIGPTKPWHEWANYSTAQPFTNAKNASPWKDIPLLKAKSSNHLRYCAKHMFNQGKILSGIKNNLQYFLVKLSK